MEWKTFEIEGECDSAKENTFKMFRLIRCLRKEDCSVSSLTTTFTVAPFEPLNSLADYSLEAELKKAQALTYQRMLDRPR